VSVWAIVPAAGTGERFGGVRPKPFADLDGKPVIVRTLEVFEQCALVEGVVLVAHQDWLKDYQDLVDTHGLKKVRSVVAGGDTRTQSVRSGLAVLPTEVDVVMVHDGVRPFVTMDMIAAGIGAVKATGAAIAAVAVKPTIKVVDPKAEMVMGTLDRELLREVQTPQVFERKLIDRAYAEDIDGATDDAALVEHLGVKVNVFMGSYTNIKITTPEDMIIARAFLGSLVRK
jgi:2-C-methyl-D-erythritol 4-phosphate cytidylyltransferase